MSTSTLDINEIILIYVDFPASVISTILAAFSIFVLTKLQTHHAIFAYIRLEFFFIFLDSLIDSFIPVFKGKRAFPALDSNWVCFSDYFIFGVISAAMELSAIVMALLASFLCLCMFNLSSLSSPTPHSSRWTWSSFLKFSPTLVAIGTLLLSLGLFCWEFICFVVTDEPSSIVDVNKSSSNQTEHECQRIDFCRTYPFNLIAIGSLLLSYGVLPIVLVLVNVIIIIRVKRSMNNKSMMLGKSGDTRRNQKRQTTERKITKLVVYDSFNVVAGRIPISVYFVMGFFAKLSPNIPFYSLMSLAIIVSFAINFLILYKLNTQFKSETQKTVKVVFNYFRVPCR